MVKALYNRTRQNIVEILNSFVYIFNTDKLHKCANFEWPVKRIDISTLHFYKLNTHKHSDKLILNIYLFFH